MENTSTSPAHTPGPWHYGTGHGKFPAGVGSRNRAPLCMMVGNDPEDAANARFIAAAPDMRQASQRFYDAVQNYLDVHDSELPAELVQAMNELEAAWRKGDGTDTARS